MPATDLPDHHGHPRGLPAFLLALLIAVGAHLGVFALLRWPAPPAPAPRELPALVHYVQAGNAGQAQAMSEAETFSDPELLYTLTRRAALTPATLPQTTLQPYALQPTADEVDRTLGQISTAPALTAHAADALKPEQWDALHSMGQSPSTRAPLPARGARLRVTMAGARSVKDITWPPELAPDAGGSLWQPANFLLLFNAAGLVGEPQLDSVAKADENPKVDEDIRKKLSDYFRLHPLPPGSYTVEIGP
jgi:hypothetical protein